MSSPVEFNKILSDRGIRQTAFRNDLIRIFQESKNTISLEDIENKLGEYDRTTLYRALKKFLEKGVIHEISIAGQNKKYAICKEECSDLEHDHQHIHFSCSICNVTNCIETDDYPKLSIPGYKIDAIEIQATGICDNCNSQ